MRLSALTPFFDIPASMERGQVGFAAWRGLLWRLTSARRGAMNQPHHVVSSVVRLALPPEAVRYGR